MYTSCTNTTEPVHEFYGKILAPVKFVPHNAQPRKPVAFITQKTPHATTSLWGGRERLSVLPMDIIWHMLVGPVVGTHWFVAIVQRHNPP
jgi:hypothetical protein